MGMTREFVRSVSNKNLNCVIVYIRVNASLTARPLRSDCVFIVFKPKWHSHGLASDGNCWCLWWFKEYRLWKISSGVLKTTLSIITCSLSETLYLMQFQTYINIHYATLDWIWECEIALKSRKVDHYNVEHYNRNRKYLTVMVLQINIFLKIY